MGTEFVTNMTRHTYQYTKWKCVAYYMPLSLHNELHTWGLNQFNFCFIFTAWDHRKYQPTCRAFKRQDPGI